MDFETTKQNKPLLNDIIKLEPDKPIKLKKSNTINPKINPKKVVTKFNEEKLSGDNIQMDEFNYNPDNDTEFQAYLDTINKKAKKNKPIVEYNSNTDDLVSTISLISKNPDKFENTNKV